MAIPDSDVVRQGLGALFQLVLDYAVVLAALGAATVGLLEAYKKVFATLARFHRQAVARWLRNESAPADAAMQLRATLASHHYAVAAPARSAPYDPAKAYAQLLHLTTGTPLHEAGLPLDVKGGALTRNVSWALFELEIGRMMAQVQEAADAALQNPVRYPDWFAFVTRGCSTEDLDAWRTVLAGTADPAARDRGAAALARIRLLVRRQLDSFQAITAFRWREWNQWWSWLVGALLMFNALLMAQRLRVDELDGGQWLTLLAASLAGGILAPVAKDLVDALSRAKAQL